MAKNAFANKVIYETESGQLYIKGVLENGDKVEGFIDKATMELKSYYPCSKYNNTIKIKTIIYGRSMVNEKVNKYNWIT